MIIAWIWFTIAILLLIIELIKTNGYTLWLSVCAAVIGTLAAYLSQFNGAYQVIVFTVLSCLLCLWWFRSLKQKPIQFNKTNIKNYIGRLYTLKKSVKNGKGQLEIDGFIWFVHSKQNLPKGTQVKITGTNGVVLLIEKYTQRS